MTYKKDPKTLKGGRLNHMDTTLPRSPLYRGIEQKNGGDMNRSEYRGKRTDLIGYYSTELGIYSTVLGVF